MDVFFTTGSRKRSHAFEVKLIGTSNRAPNDRGRSGEKAATWDEWGMFLAALYAVDPDMLTGASGRPAYASADAFHAATGDRYLHLTAPYQHRTHKWERMPHGTSQSVCTGCEATRDLDYMYVKV